MKRVYGSYLTAADARQAVDELLQQEYTRNDIKVVSDRDLDRDLKPKEEDEHDDRGLWEKIKDAFTFDEYDEDYWDRDLDADERAALEGYKANLQAGEIIVLLEEGTGQHAGTFYEGDTEFQKHFKDGVPDWDEREREFNEGVGEEDERGMVVEEDLHPGQVRDEEDLRDKYPEDSNKKPRENMVDRDNLGKDNYGDSSEDHMNRANVGKNNLNSDNAGSIDVNINTSDKYGDGNLKTDTSRVDESSLRNQDRDPLKNRNLNDDGLRSEELKDLERAEAEREKLDIDDLEMTNMDKEDIEALEAEKLEEQRRKDIQEDNPMI